MRPRSRFLSSARGWRGPRTRVRRRLGTSPPGPRRNGPRGRPTTSRFCGMERWPVESASRFVSLWNGSVSSDTGSGPICAAGDWPRKPGSPWSISGLGWWGCTGWNFVRARATGRARGSRKSWGSGANLCPLRLLCLRAAGVRPAALCRSVRLRSGLTPRHESKDRSALGAHRFHGERQGMELPGGPQLELILEMWARGIP
jgi:hypothetical protein